MSNLLLLLYSCQLCPAKCEHPSPMTIQDIRHSGRPPDLPEYARICPSAQIDALFNKAKKITID